MTGPVTQMTVPLVQATKNYIRHVNEQGGIQGKGVKLIIEDDRYTIPGAIAGFKKLVFRDKALLILYGGGTGQTMALSNQYEKHKKPLITVSLAERLVQPVRKYIFTPAASYEDEVKVIFDYILKTLNAKNPRIAFTYPDTEHGKTGLRAARERAKFYNIKMVTEEVVGLNILDASSQVLSLKRAKADYVIAHSGVGQTVVLLRDARKFAYKPTFIGDYYTCGEDLIQIAGKAAEKFIGVHSFNSWYDDTPGVGEMRDITLKYQPDTKIQTKFYTQGWVTSLIAIEAIKKAGEDLNGDTVVDAFESLREFDTKGLCGVITYSPTQHKPNQYCRFYKPDLEKTIFTPLTDWVKPLK
ncbi:MAG: ABC transporter substrate-binding protein [Thermodesulfobacteriota bacterium]|nr:ABC transporter substrate-binding protein [Thermodesulfobacteriota bacterium]